MSRKQIVLASMLALLALVVGVLALGTRRAPFLPADEDHAREPAVACPDCHGPDGASPRRANHPLGDDCFRCHARR